jgi:tetratricopeptide (TPR) repeat protein
VVTRTLAEARKAFDVALALNGIAAPQIEARALTEAGLLASEEGDADAAVALGRKAVSVARLLEEPLALASTLRWLGLWLSETGDRDAARQAVRESIALARRFGLDRAYAEGLHFLAEVELLEGAFERAAALLTESLQLHNAAARDSLAAQTGHSLGDAQLEQGRFDEAGATYRQSLARAWATRDARDCAYNLAGLAASVAASGDIEAAGRLWSAVRQFEEQRGALINSTSRQRYERRFDAVDSAALENALEHGRSMTFDEAVEYALSHHD